MHSSEFIDFRKPEDIRLKGTFTYLILCPSLGDGKLTLRHLSLGDGKLTLRLRQRRLGHQDLQWVTGGQRLRDYQIEAVVIMYQIEIVVIMNAKTLKMPVTVAREKVPIDSDPSTRKWGRDRRHRDGDVVGSVSVPALIDPGRPTLLHSKFEHAFAARTNAALIDTCTRRSGEIEQCPKKRHCYHLRLTPGQVTYAASSASVLLIKYNVDRHPEQLVKRSC
ncbi:hypothetical protein GEV33_012625 [Tenebrio molitor]|uniref:Uncharacterized protein n=1 Tax=Tenebrio molitor TaxID=7067 RepID=A0A8J6H9F3_TENMO|nr:hypothetical protein GEV33_012625 [Tenebrio molitor]